MNYDELSGWMFGTLGDGSYTLKVQGHNKHRIRWYFLSTKVFPTRLPCHSFPTFIEL